MYSTTVSAPIVFLSGEVIDTSNGNILFKHKLPRSSKEIVTVIAASQIIVVTKTEAVFYANSADYKQAAYYGELTDVTSVENCPGLLKGTDEEGNEVVFSAKCSSVECEPPEPKKIRKTSKKKNGK